MFFQLSVSADSLIEAKSRKLNAKRLIRQPLSVIRYPRVCPQSKIAETQIDRNDYRLPDYQPITLIL